MSGKPKVCHPDQDDGDDCYGQYNYEDWEEFGEKEAIKRFWLEEENQEKERESSNNDDMPWSDVLLNTAKLAALGLGGYAANKMAKSMQLQQVKAAHLHLVNHLVSPTTALLDQFADRMYREYGTLSPMAEGLIVQAEEALSSLQNMIPQVQSATTVEELHPLNAQIHNFKDELYNSLDGMDRFDISGGRIGKKKQRKRSRTTKTKGKATCK